jgi:hypothetical protein
VSISKDEIKKRNDMIKEVSESYENLKRQIDMFSVVVDVILSYLIC